MAYPYSDYDSSLVRERVANWPLFDHRFYLHINRDIAQNFANAVSHFAERGMWEERPFTTDVRLASDLALIGMPKAQACPPPNAQAIAMLACDFDIGIYASAKGNFFMREIAHSLALGLRNLGFFVTEGSEETPPDDRREHTIIVAPHEFFFLGKGTDWARHDVIANSIMLSTEVPQTPWFPKSLPYLLACKGVLDLCWQSSQSLSKAGIASSFYTPAIADTWRLTDEPADIKHNDLIRSLTQTVLDFADPDGPLSERPLDVSFMATESLARDEFLGRHMKMFTDLNTVLIYRRTGQGVPKPYADEQSITRVNNYIWRRTKILLNIHQDALGYFEIDKLGMQGMWNKCAVVTNKCLPHPYFKANEHYFEETIDRIPKLIHWLIRTPEGRKEAERVRGNALLTYCRVASARQQSLCVAALLRACFFQGEVTS